MTAETKAPSELTVWTTRNTEYYVVDWLCVAVRDLQTGCVDKQHIAVGERIGGALSFLGGGALELRDRLPRIGERLCFRDISLVTSCVCAIRRGVRCRLGVLEDAA